MRRAQDQKAGFILFVRLKGRFGIRFVHGLRFLKRIFLSLMVDFSRALWQPNLSRYEVRFGE